MWLISLRDLQWRRRRFVIAVMATGLVFGITLLLAGINASFQHEIDHTVGSFHATAWIVPTAAAGPFTSSAAFPAAVAGQVARSPGVHQADPMVVTRVTLPGDDTEGPDRLRDRHPRDRAASNQRPQPATTR